MTAPPGSPGDRPLGLEGGEGTRVRAFAPGRVNLIGEHTDYARGLALPMAVHLGTTVDAVRGGTSVELSSDHDPTPLHLPLPVGDPASVSPQWGRYVAGVASVLAGQRAQRETREDARAGAGRGSVGTLGLRGSITTTLPVGAGLSSSASLEVAVALALGALGSARSVAELARDAEEAASGVPCGLMDQLASTCGIPGHALLLDFASGDISPVPLPEAIEVVVVHSGQERRLAASPYAQRRREIEAAIDALGDPRTATLDDVGAVGDPVLRRRARHLVTENQRVLAFVEALGSATPSAAGEILDEGHASLRDDLEVSTPAVEELCSRLRARPGVLGVRLTGAGFGGCVVAVTEPGALEVGWTVRPGPGAQVTSG